MTGRSFVAGDELLGDVIEIVADDPRLRTDAQYIVADPPDQRRVPAGGHGAECVPRMACDKTKLRGCHSKLFLDVGVGLT
jgi:hypothetical protein